MDEPIQDKAKTQTTAKEKKKTENTGGILQNKTDYLP